MEQKQDCKNFFFTYSKDKGFCCFFHENQYGYLQSDVWHLLDGKLFRNDFGFTLEEFKEQMKNIKKKVDEGKSIMYYFDWYTKTTERDKSLRRERQFSEVVA